MFSCGLPLPAAVPLIVPPTVPAAPYSAWPPPIGALPKFAPSALVLVGVVGDVIVPVNVPVTGMLACWDAVNVTFWLPPVAPMVLPLGDIDVPVRRPAAPKPP